jgi:hypothetical protein
MAKHGVTLKVTLTLTEMEGSPESSAEIAMELVEEAIDKFTAFYVEEVSTWDCWEIEGHKYEDGVCGYCGLKVRSDGIVLIDETEGDACGVPALISGVEHGHCRGFVAGENLDNCAECGLNKADHNE